MSDNFQDNNIWDDSESSDSRDFQNSDSVQSQNEINDNNNYTAASSQVPETDRYAGERSDAVQGDGCYHYRGSELNESSYQSSGAQNNGYQNGGYQSSSYQSNYQNGSYQNSGYQNNSYESSGTYQSSGQQDSNYNSYKFSSAGNDSTYNHTAKDHTKNTKKAKKEKKKSGTGQKFGVCIALAATFGLVAGGVFLGVASVGSKALGLNEPETSVEIPKVELPQETAADAQTQTVSSSAGNLTVAQVAESCMPAMVAITNKSIQEIPNYFGYGSQSYESESSGSGIIIDQNDTELLIATNNHVVSGADSLTVAFVDDELVEATVKGTDADNDLAIVSVKISDIKEETLQQIKVIQIGDSDELKVGDQVVAIGNALGFGQSVSSGYVSALEREVTIDNATHTLIQTDAAINPGNSGGALLNMKGELIAINEAKYSSSDVEGMGYAIPVSTATPILSELMSQETRYKVADDQASYMGVVCRELSEEFSQVYGVPTGAFVDSVEEGGPADQAGIQKGDIIVKLDTKNVSSYTDLVDALQYYAAGETVDITVCRADNGEYVERVLTITLGEKKQ